MRKERATQAVTLFGIVVGLSVAVAFLLFVRHLVDAFSDAGQGTGGAVAVPQPLDVAPALALAPFGRADHVSAPPTSLALELRGVVLMTPRERSTALIGPPGGAPAVYRIGQAVAGGTIEDIAMDRVILRVAGRLERLDLPRMSVAASAPAPAATGGLQPLAVSQTIATPPPAGLPAPIVALFQSIPAMPTASGYRVGAPLSSNAQQAGLQPGDIIERINGMPALNLTADRTQLAALLASGYAQVGVLRGERRLSLSFPFR